MSTTPFDASKYLSYGDVLALLGEAHEQLKATEDERDDIHREMMDLRYQLAQAKAA